ncbi:MAG TPA: hypothetical protein VJH37_02605 [Candidatus Nanoarchaeia archaeon]|nr:hypothetical protein [Candidatus Nanoarchaeia archaeon]
MNLDTAIQKADKEFRLQCARMSYMTWNVTPSDEYSFLTGVTTAWPERYLQYIRDYQLPNILTAAMTTALFYNLVPVLFYPAIVAGGSIAVYVGWETPKFKNLS